MTSSTARSACVVLLRNLGQGMLYEIVAAAVKRQPDVVVYEERSPEGSDVDLVIERDDETGAAVAPTLVVSGNGRALFTMPIEQLSVGVLELAVSSVVALNQMNSAGR